MAELYEGIPYIDITAVAAQLNFLGDIDPAEQVVLFANSVKEVTLHAMGTLCRQDAPITHVWVLLEGKIAQARRDVDAQGNARQYLMRDCLPGALIGVYDYLFSPDSTYRARARALEPCRLLAIEIGALGRLIYRYPEVRRKLAPMESIARLSTFPLVGEVELVGLGFLADALKQSEAQPQQVLYRSGDKVDTLYLLSQGQVELKWDKAEPLWVANGSLLGLAEDAGAGSVAVTVRHTCTVTFPSALYTVAREAFVAITGIVPDRRGLAAIAERVGLVGQLPIFAAFSSLQKRQVAGYFSYNHYPSNHLLIQQNEHADSMWVLMPNSRAVIRALDASGQHLTNTAVTGPTFFGETALLGEIAQDSTVEADANSDWLRLHWRDFERCDEVDPADLRAMLKIKSSKQPKMVGKEARSKYPWLQVGESVVYFSRRHWVAFLRKNAATLVFLALLLILLAIALILPGTQVWLIAANIVLVIMTAVALAWGIADYRNDWLVVTNRRVVYQEKLLFVHVWRKEAPLEQIQSVDFRRTIWGRWLGYGTLVVQTAGTQGTIMFNYTTDFDQLKKVIRSQQDQRKRHVAAISKMQIHRQLEKRLVIPLNPPSKVFVRSKGAAPKEPQTWRTWLYGKQGLGIRWEEGNRIVWRKHWMALVPRLSWAWIILFLLFLLWVASWAATQRMIPIDLLQASGVIAGILIVLVLLFLGRLAWVIVDWYNDTYEVNDTDVINVRKLPFGIDENRRSAPLQRIQNVEMRIPSPIHWLFDYGDVVIQTAAEFGALIFYSVPDPRAVADEILSRMALAQRKQEEDEMRRRSQDLPDWFEMYSRLEPVLPAGGVAEPRNGQAPPQPAVNGQPRG